MLESMNEAVWEITSETEADGQAKVNLFELLSNTSAVQSPDNKDNQQIHGVITGMLTGFDESGAPLVTSGEKPAAGPLAARSVVALSENEIGREIILMFESGNLRKPIVMGVIEPATRKKPGNSLSVEIDGERVILTAEKEIVLRCGEASITLTRAGKVLIRGAYLSSRSSGVNRIKGGSIQLN